MRLLFALLQVIPRGLLSALLSGVTLLAYALGVRRKYALEGLATAFPEKSPRERRALARANYRHLGRCAADVLRAPGMSDEALFALVDPVDWERATSLVTPTRGVIVATAHIGNFELFGVYGARRKLPLAILTRKLKGGVNAQWVARRAFAGIREIHSGYSNLFASIEQGDMLAILIDQNMIPRRAVFAPFFGTLAATTPAPAVVAEKTGAPVFLANLLRTPEGRYRTVFDGPWYFPENPPDRDAAILAFTARLNERFEALVRQHPEQWFWVHRRWKTRPPPTARS